MNSVRVNMTQGLEYDRKNLQLALPKETTENLV
jgi:hypothetical protein